jgi:hypothetical protein
MSEPIMGLAGGPKQLSVVASLKTEVLPPRHIAGQHWRELVEGSAIAPAVAALNFRSFGDGCSTSSDAERNALLRPALELLNPQPGFSAWARRRLEERYGHFDGGGWRFVGDCLPGYEATSCWKPNTPRCLSRGFGKASKPVKYETSPKRRPGLFLCQVPLEAWQRIAEANGLAMPADTSCGFWAWALATPGLHLVICEGPKKAAALISAGIAAVGLSGVWNGRIVDRNGFERVGERLIPELLALAPGRAFTILFDADVKASTARAVDSAAVRLGHCLTKAGATVRIAQLELLNGAKCGPDDLLVAKGPQALQKVLQGALSVQERAWQRRYNQERRLMGLQVKAKHLLDAVPALPEAPIVGIRSAKGTGKTESLARWLQAEPQAICLTHRRSLGASISSRLGLAWRNDLDNAGGLWFDPEGQSWTGAPPRLALCIDSLLALPVEAFEGAVLVLDEAEQLLHHLLSSATIKQRGLVWQRFIEVIGRVKQAVALDADLSDSTLLLLQQARRLYGASDGLQLISNHKAPQQWQVHWHEQAKPDAIQQALIEAASKGPVFVVVDSKRRAEALHGLLQHHFPQAKGLLITSDTTATPEGAAAIAKLPNAQELAEVKWVIASPSISSGLSVEHLHFQSVFGLFGAGTFDDAEALQALARVRSAVVRHVWCQQVVLPKDKPISSAWWTSQVEGDLRQRWQEQCQRLRQELQPDVFSADGKAQELLDLAIEHWSIVQSRRNYSLAHLRAFIKARLKHEGHQLIEHREPLADAEAKALDGLRKELKQERQAKEAQAVMAAPVISKQQAEDLQRRQFLLPEQQAALQKRIVCERLALDPRKLTAPLIQWADQWAAAAKRLAMLLEPEMAKQADIARLKATTPSGQAPLPFDQSFRSQEAAAAEALGLRSFIVDHVLALKSWNSDTPEAAAVADKARHYAVLLRSVMGVTISHLPYVAKDKRKGQPGQGESNASIIGKLLKRYGLTTVDHRTGSKQRSYSAEVNQLGLVVGTAKRLQEQAFGCSTSPGLVNTTSPGGASDSDPLDRLPHPPIRAPFGRRHLADQLELTPFVASGLPNPFRPCPSVPSGSFGASEQL